MVSGKVMELDLESLKNVVDELQRRLKEDEDPAEMGAYRKAFRKLVPMFMRSYVAGYLLRQLASQGRVRRKMSAITLFLSIGKNRRVYPRDLAQLLMAAAGLSKTDIGDIKVLDNYSFIEVDEKAAALVISRLDGMEYRGRSLTVNFAKKREERSERQRETEPAGSLS